MLMQSSTGDLKITGADINGPKFRQLVLEGYKFIGFIWGLNAGVIIDKQNLIIKADQENL